MITFLLSEVGYTNDCLFLSLVLWTFPNNELNHSLCRKGFKNQYCKSQRQKDRAEAHNKCQTALSQLKRKSFRQGYKFKNAGLANTSQSSHLEQVGSQLMPGAMLALPRGSTWPPHKEDVLWSQHPYVLCLAGSFNPCIWKTQMKKEISLCCWSGSSLHLSPLI